MISKVLKETLNVESLNMIKTNKKTLQVIENLNYAHRNWYDLKLLSLIDMQYQSVCASVL